MDCSRPQLSMGRGLFRVARPVTAALAPTDRDTLHDAYRRVRDFTETLSAPLSPIGLTPSSSIGADPWRVDVVSRFGEADRSDATAGAT